MIVGVLWNTKEIGTVAGEVEMPLELGKGRAWRDALAFPRVERKSPDMRRSVMRGSLTQ